jgi:hypothetical protein
MSSAESVLREGLAHQGENHRVRVHVDLEPTGRLVYLKCSGCFVTYLFGIKVVDEVWRELLFERTDELVECINGGEDFRVKYFTGYVFL